MTAISETLRFENLAAQEPKQIVILLHGYGGSNVDWRGCVELWRPQLPEATFLAPNSPFATPTGHGYQWWPLDLPADDAGIQQVRSMTDQVSQLIERELTCSGLQSRPLAIVGFSQGALLAINIGLCGTTDFSGVLAYSTCAGPRKNPCASTHRVPVLLVHGAKDQVADPAASIEWRDRLGQSGIDAHVQIIPGLGHEVDPRASAVGGGFLKEVLTNARGGNLGV